ncbi:prolipoprotein diacylglyceryl transferase [Parvularcula sp. IMCC14364]|uniref:prolipoprotein diacylglyceryl transferase n=1 Tax=Parvularcula sp. IMCC14364 TaxID=3067902 RepID=UPI00274219DA|nr:prolipoprotein diacylglyceryl transferase [Parvularcula sp. IMCC14364]
MPLLQLPYPEIDPVFFSIGPFPIRWYALAYIAGITIGWFYVTRLMQNTALWKSTITGTAPAGPPISREKFDDLLFWVTLGVILGGRLGYVFFYEPGLLTAAWVSVRDIMGGEGIIQTLLGWIHIPPALMMWNGGMSFHGGLIGVTLAGYLYSRKHSLNALAVGDLFACAAPIGLFFGRIANFINAELYGRETDVAWGMVFPTDPEQLVRHPSQLYEAFLEGLVLFIIIRIATHRFGILSKPGFAIGLFLAGYGIARSIVELFRQPDLHMPDFPLGLTMGIILSLPMIALGAYLIWRANGGHMPKHDRGPATVTTSLDATDDKTAAGEDTTARPSAAAKTDTKESDQQ